MYPPRSHIARVMILVAVVAVEFGAIQAVRDMQYRAVMNGSPGRAEMISALLLGAIPMANVLALGFLIGLRRRDGNLFLLGFETFGAAALGLFIAGASLFTEEIVAPFFRFVRENLVTPWMNGPYITTTSLLVLYAVVIAMLTLPQLAFALIGGFLFRHFRTGEDHSSLEHVAPGVGNS